MKHSAAILLLAASLLACDDERPSRPGAPPDQPPRPAKPTSRPRASTSASASAAVPVPVAPPSAEPKKRDLDQKCAPAEEGADPLDIGKFVLTSKLEDRKPTDELTIIQPGTKVYAYLVVKNLGKKERCVLVTFRVNGKKRASLTLEIGTSPTWRTWAHITPAEGDAPGQVEVEITDDQGRQRYLQKVLVEPKK
jgi:hypothetical protein